MLILPRNSVDQDETPYFCYFCHLQRGPSRANENQSSEDREREREREREQDLHCCNNIYANWMIENRQSKIIVIQNLIQFDLMGAKPSNGVYHKITPTQPLPKFDCFSANQNIPYFQTGGQMCTHMRFFAYRFLFPTSLFAVSTC